MDRGQFADFLRIRRAALAPADVGLPAGARRRTVGLRREEVAALAVISTDYYTRMEQQRGPIPSPDVLASLARALRLSPDERDHLFRLAGHHAPARAVGGQQVSQATMRILDRLADTPAQVMSALGETLMQTPAARALLGEETAFEGMSRSVVFRWFTTPDARRVYPEEDRAEVGRRFVADARVVYAREGPTSRAAEVVRALLDRSDEFAVLWKRHDVVTTLDHSKRIAHPTLGVLDVQCQILYDAAQSHTLLVFTAEPGTDSHAKLAALGADPEAYLRHDVPGEALRRSLRGIDDPRMIAP